MYITQLVNITSRSWTLPILSGLHNGIPGRQAPLLKATGANRTAFAQSMNHLIEIGLMQRNPGHGHPLRPEFRLTQAGAKMAAFASRIMNVSEQEQRDLLRKTWTLPVLAALQSPSHFNQIKRSLITITDRALSQSLQSLEERKWLERQVNVEARPPKPIYFPINSGRKICEVAKPEISFAIQ